MNVRGVVMAFVALPLAAAAGHAQRPGGVRPNPRMEQRLEQLPPAQRRALLEQRLRQGLWRAAKLRVGFTDEQMVQLEKTSQRFDQRRRELGRAEQGKRQALRAQVVADTSASQQAIADLLDQLQELQRQRMALQAEEQKEFATFMTPLQRAKYMGLQEQLRRRMQEIVRARPDAGRGGDIPPL